MIIWLVRDSMTQRSVLLRVILMELPFPHFIAGLRDALHDTFQRNRL